jgi:hypothetical protein
MEVLINERHADLPPHFKPMALQFVVKTFLVNALEQSRPEGLMNLKRGVNDDARGLVNRVGYRFSL